MVPEVRTRLASISAACERLGIIRLWLVGSAIGDALHRPFDSQSDVDFVVEIDRDATPLRGWSDPFWKLWIELEDIFAPRPIQLIEAGAIRSGSLADAIDRSRELLYDSARAKAAG